jgi:hypothetical protein
MESRDFKKCGSKSARPAKFPEESAACIFKVNTEAAISFQKLVPVYQTTCCHITKRYSLHTHPVENLKSHNILNTYLGTALGDPSD